ncbi:MAG TPA: DUF3098 domain-containing protein [Ignavibacteria bacterium]|nr:DUF3098 domain-containing protein [Ignavibacteria bacterium]
MAKTKTSKVQNLKSKKTKKSAEHLHISLGTKNYMIIGLGILLIIIGYFLMSENSVDGFMPTTVAPILLFIGYCFMIPFGILYKEKKTSVDEIVIEDTSTEEVKQNSSVSGNIRTV